MSMEVEEFLKAMHSIEEAAKDICHEVEELPKNARCSYGVCVKIEDDGFVLYLKTGDRVFRCGKHRSIVHAVTEIGNFIKNAPVTLALAMAARLQAALGPIAKHIRIEDLPNMLRNELKKLEVKEYAEVKASRIPRIFQEILAPERKLIITVPELIIRCGLKEYRISVDMTRPADRILAMYDAIRNGFETDDIEVDELIKSCRDGVDVSIDYVPKLTVLRTLDNRVVVVDGVVKSGRIEGYVESIDSSQLFNKISIYLTPHTIDQLNRVFKKVLGKIFYDYERNTIVSSISNDSILWVSHRLPEPILMAIAKEWDRHLEQLFEPYDKTLAQFYKAYIIEYPYPRVAPHAVCITNPHVGKSTLAQHLGLRLDRATPVAIAGGMNPETRKLEEGIVHGVRYLVQIEGLESGKEIDTIRYALNLMAMGIAESGVGTRTIVTRTSAPFVFTANTSSMTKDREAEAAKLLYNLSYENPMALAHRVSIPLYLPDLATVKMVSPSEEWVSIARVIRVFRSATYDRYAKIFYNKKVLDWLSEKPSSWEGLSKLIDIVEKIHSENLKKFLFEYIENGYLKAKTHALGTAISENLGDIILEKMGIDDIINYAEDVFEEWTVQIVARSIMNMVNMAMAISKAEVLEKTLSKSDKALLYAVLRYVNAVNPTEKRMEDLEYVLSYAADYVRKNIRRISIPELARRLSKKASSFLREFGVEIIGSRVAIDPTIVKNVEAIIKRIVEA